MTKKELEAALCVANATIASLRARLAAQKTVGASNARGTERHAFLKEEYLRRTRNGESVVIASGKVWATEELRAYRVAH